MQLKLYIKCEERCKAFSRGIKSQKIVASELNRTELYSCQLLKDMIKEDEKQPKSGHVNQQKRNIAQNNKEKLPG